ncbi:MAG TPA: hypothetical protein ENK23_01000, partial [Sorangium sp.]|nr:hypothetical protein [Sorangium sp.]
MAKPKSRFVNCDSCGAKNVRSASRCGTCGVALDEPRSSRSAPRSRARRYQQESFSVRWALIAVVVHAVLTAALIVALPQAVSALDFEGYYGMSLTIPVWFVGGLLVGMISPGKTFVEPVVAAVMVAL